MRSGHRGSVEEVPQYAEQQVPLGDTWHPVRVILHVFFFTLQIYSCVQVSVAKTNEKQGSGSRRRAGNAGTVAVLAAGRVGGRAPRTAYPPQENIAFGIGVGVVVGVCGQREACAAIPLKCRRRHSRSQRKEHVYMDRFFVFAPTGER